MKQKIEKKQEITISPIEVATTELKIVGLSSLLMEKMSEKIEQEMINKMQGQGKEKKQIKNFEAEVKEKIWYTDDGKVGFPASGFKKAMVSSAPYLEGMDMKKAKGSFIVMGNIIPIKFKEQTINKAVGKDSGIKKSPRPIWRPEFREWSCVLPIRYNAGQITINQIVELAKLAGFHIGVGGWTPQHNGSYGTFTVAFEN